MQPNRCRKTYNTRYEMPQSTNAQNIQYVTLRLHSAAFTLLSKGFVYNTQHKSQY